jgi:hypothetical protein
MFYLSIARYAVAILLFCSFFCNVLSAPPNTKSRFPPSRKIPQSFTESEISAAQAELTNNQNQPAFSQPVSNPYEIVGPLPVAASQPDVTTAKIERAKALVATAQEAVAAYNSFRMANPRRNTHTSKKHGGSKKKREEVAPPVFSEEVLSAAALLAEINSADKYRHGTLYKTYPRDNHLKPLNEKRATASQFWMEGVDESKGTQPYGGSTTYKVSGRLGSNT